MSQLSVIAREFSRSSDGLDLRRFMSSPAYLKFCPNFETYLDAFDPVRGLPFSDVEIIGRRVVPPLLRTLAEQELEVVVADDLRTVADLYRASNGRMKRLIPTNDPRYHPKAGPRDTFVLALMRGAVPQGCVATRLLWCEDSLAEEMESGRFWVSQPATMWTAADRCIVRAPIAKRIKGCYVAFTGSIYLAQEVTGGNTLAAMLRLHYLWLAAHWRFTWMLGIIEGALARKHAFDVYGYQGMDPGIWRTRPGEDDQLHKYELVYSDRETARGIWLSPEIGDLTVPIGHPRIAQSNEPGLAEAA